MPDPTTYPLPTADYLGDPGRTTSEFQTAINQLLAYTLAMKAELDVQTSHNIARGATLDTASAAQAAAGTSANVLLTAEGGAQLLEALGWTRAQFSPHQGREVWNDGGSGTVTSVAMSSLSETGPGFYELIDAVDGSCHIVHVNDPTKQAYGSAYPYIHTSTGVGVISAYLDSGSNFRLVQAYSSYVYRAISSIKKL